MFPNFWPFKCSICKIQFFSFNFWVHVMDEYEVTCLYIHDGTDQSEGGRAQGYTPPSRAASAFPHSARWWSCDHQRDSAPLAHGSRPHTSWSTGNMQTEEPHLQCLILQSCCAAVSCSVSPRSSPCGTTSLRRPWWSSSAGWADGPETSTRTPASPQNPHQTSSDTLLPSAGCRCRTPPSTDTHTHTF